MNDLGAGSLKRGCGGVRAGKSDHLMAGVEQFGNDG